MPLVLTDEQAMLQESAAGFLAESGVKELRRVRDERDADGFSRDLWKAFADMGFTGILAPEAFGGLGLGHVEAGVVMEEIGRNLTPSPFLSTAVLGVSALKHASDERKSDLLPKIIAGDLITALAVDEGAKHNPARTAMTAARSGNGFKLDGKKGFVVDGHVADLMIVAARTGGAAGEQDGLTLFMVDPKAKGVAIERTVMVDAHNAARIEFDGVEVDADAVLGEVDGGWKLLEGVLNTGRAAVASEMVGVGDEAFVRTVDYLKQRQQFGKLIGEFQALQHRSAHLWSDLEVTKAAVLKCLQMLDEAPEAAAPYVSVAKARAGRTVTLAVQEAVQMFGGIGMTDEVDIGLFMKRGRVGQELFGDDNFHADRIARMASY